MNLFEYIAENLTVPQKQDLYKEKSVCLCLFRVAFNDLSMQQDPITDATAHHHMSPDQQAVIEKAYAPPGLYQ